MSDYQLIVIGSGPGGYVAAIRAAQEGLKTALIEERDCGGTCLNRGCIPTKALLHTSSLYSSSVNEFRELGIDVDAPALNWEKMHSRKVDVVQQLRGGVEGLLKGNKVDLLRGHGKLLGQGRVEFSSAEETRELSADHILLATGSEPDFPDVPGMDLEGVISSDEILEGTPKQVRHIAILGGGVIGVEFAAFYNNLGIEVTLIVTSPRLLRKMDKELATTLNSIFKRSGIKVMVNAALSSVTRGENGLDVHLDIKGKEDIVTADQVLIAKGRRPFLKGLLGEGVGLEMNRRFIRVNERFETSIPGVYAIGDVIGGQQLAHEAEVEGQCAVAYMVGKEPETCPRTVPGCIYTQPEIASVGLSEDEAAEQGIEYEVGKYLMAGNSKSIIDGQGRGFIKFLFAKDTGKVLGVHMICGRASDLISEFATAIVKGATHADLLSGMRPHPSYCEGITEALEALHDRSIHTMPRRR